MLCAGGPFKGGQLAELFVLFLVVFVLILFGVRGVCSGGGGTQHDHGKRGGAQLRSLGHGHDRGCGSARHARAHIARRARNRDLVRAPGFAGRESDALRSRSTSSISLALRQDRTVRRRRYRFRAPEPRRLERYRSRPLYCGRSPRLRHRSTGRARRVPPSRARARFRRQHC